VSFNAPAVIAALVVVGLNIDYGIFMVYTAKAELYPETLRATFLSAFTTVAGAASLLLAKHPVLYSIGFTLVSGLAFGCLAAILIVPAMYRLWFIKVPKIQSA
jgi:predicted RND superfamily exporter protein